MLLRDFGVKLKSCLCENAASSVCLPNQNDVPSQKRLVPRSTGPVPRVQQIGNEVMRVHETPWVP